MIDNRRVVAIAYDGLCAFEFGIAVELFGLARPELAVPWYEFRVVAATNDPIRALGGITIKASADLRHVRGAGTIVLPGWNDKDIQPPSALLAALRSAHANGARIMSICSGVYVLAASGLLDGLAATTHWRYVEHLAAHYPAIDVRPNVLFVDNGQTLTSAGSAAGIDCGLHLIRRDHGAAIAGDVARRLVAAPQREGGQAQYIRHATTIPDSTDRRIVDVVTWVQAHLDDAITIQGLASMAHMSTRTFARRFLAEMGTSPLAWVLVQRLRLAQTLLETTKHSLTEIARAAGFPSVETMRHHFRTELGTSPTRYRSTFALAPESRAG
jgi:AraC family transcriptional regulator, transcriptional activator FtrA